MSIKIELSRFRNFSFGDILTSIVMYVVSYLLNSNLSDSELGAYSYYNNILLMTYPIVSLNIYESYLRFIDKYALQKKVKIISFISFLVMFAGTYLIWNDIRISMLSCIILFQERIYYLRSLVKILWFNLFKVLHAILTLTLVFYFLYEDGLIYQNVILSYGLSYLLVYLIILIFNRYKIRYNTEQKESISLNKVLKYTIPIIGSSLMIWTLNVSDLYIIEYYFSFKEVGQYSIANRVINLIRVVNSMFLLYWPIMYFRAMDEEDYTKITKIRFGYILILVAITTLIILLREYIYIAMGAGKYLEYIYYFIVLMIAELFRVVAGIFLIFRSYTVQTYYNLYLLLVITLLNVILNLYYIPKLGVVFAAYSTLLSTTAYLILSYIFSYLPELKVRTKIDE